jgi:hypothetical protein
MTGEGLCCRAGNEEDLGGSANAGPTIRRPDATKAKRMRMTFLRPWKTERVFARQHLRNG